MDFDVLIIGSGAGGGMAALRLCERGLKVGLVERGPRFDPRKDFIMNHDDWETRTDPLDQARQQEDTIDKEYRTSLTINGNTSRRGPLNYHRVQGVGGSTLHYQGEAHRFAKHAFSTKSDLGFGLDWPIRYQDLAPYYHQAEQLLGVAGNAENPFKPERGAFPTPAHPLSPKSQILAKAAAKAGFSLVPNMLALPSQSVDGRLPCQHSGACNYGCVFGAKSSIDQAIIPRAEKTGNLTLLSETRVLNLNLGGQGEITSINCQTNSGPTQLSAKRYVLAGGAIETPRLMLASRNANNSQGLANELDQVGRYFMETVFAIAFFKLSEPLKTFQGPPLDSRVWDFHKPIDANTSGFVLGIAGYLQPNYGPSQHAIYTPGIGRAHKSLVRKTFGRELYVFGVTEQEPLADNRITLSDKLDAQGIAKVSVHNQYSKRDHHTIEVMHTKLREWVAAAPSSGISASVDSKRNSSATHVAGTCRMGDDPSTSVVDAYGKVNNASNCYIADGSVMPTQGAGDSPSLTIQALALRTADRIIDDLKSE